MQITSVAFLIASLLASAQAYKYPGKLDKRVVPDRTVAPTAPQRTVHPVEAPVVNLQQEAQPTGTRNNAVARQQHQGRRLDKGTFPDICDPHFQQAPIYPGNIPAPNVQEYPAIRPAPQHRVYPYWDASCNFQSESEECDHHYYHAKKPVEQTADEDEAVEAEVVVADAAEAVVVEEEAVQALGEEGHQKSPECGCKPAHHQHHHHHESSSSSCEQIGFIRCPGGVHDLDCCNSCHLSCSSSDECDSSSSSLFPWSSTSSCSLEPPCVFVPRVYSRHTRPCRKVSSSSSSSSCCPRCPPGRVPNH